MMSRTSQAPLLGQIDFEAAFAAADAKAEAAERRREFRRELIRGLGLSENVERLLLAMESLANQIGWIDDDGNTYLDPSKEELATEMDCAVSTVKRNWKIAERLGYLFIEQVPGKTNIFTIAWPNIFEDVSAQHSTRGGTRGRTRGRTREVRRGTIEGVHRGGRFRYETAETLPLEGIHQGVQEGGHKGVLHEFMNHEYENEFMKDGVSEISQEKKKPPEPVSRPQPAAAPTSSPPDLPKKRAFSLATASQKRSAIDPEELKDPRIVEELWRLCLKHPMTREKYRDVERHRLLFFQLASLIARKSNRLDSPIGFFHCLLGQGLEAIAKQVDDEHDLAWAKKALRSLDPHAIANTRSPPSSAAQEDYAQERSFEQMRAEQMRRLREEFPVK